MASKVTRKFELMFWDMAIPVLSSARDVRDQMSGKRSAGPAQTALPALPTRPLALLNQGVILVLAAISGFALGVFFYLMVS